MRHDTSPRARRWPTLTKLAAVFAACLLLLAACGDDDDGGDASPDTNAETSSASTTKVRISSQDFGEQKTLAQVYGQFLEAKGFDVEIQDPIGSRTQLYAALDRGDIDLVIDYQGSAVVELGGESSSDADENYSTLTDLLGDKDLEAGARSEAADANALVALKTWAEENDVTTISDLSDVEGDLTLGGAAECANRDDCLEGYNSPDVYGLSLEFKQVAYGPALVTALEADEIQLAQYGTTAPEVSTGTIVVLEDDKGLQSAENVVPVFRSDISSDELKEALDELSAALTTEDLAGWNQSTDVDKEDPADVAEAWLKEKGLI